MKGGGGGVVVNQNPDHPIRNGYVFGRTVHPQGDRMATSQRGGYTAAYASQTEILAEHRNAGLAKTANHGLHFLDLSRPLRTIERNIVPGRRIEGFDSG